MLLTAKSRSTSGRRRRIAYSKATVPAAIPIRPALAPERMSPSAPVTTASQPIRLLASSTAAKPMPSVSAESAAKSE